MTERLQKILDVYGKRSVLSQELIDYIEELERTDKKALEVIKAMDDLNKQNADRLKEIEELEKEVEGLKEDRLKLVGIRLLLEIKEEEIKQLQKSHGA